MHAFRVLAEYTADGDLSAPSSPSPRSQVPGPGLTIFETSTLVLSDTGWSPGPVKTISTPLIVQVNPRKISRFTVYVGVLSANAQIGIS